MICAIISIRNGTGAHSAADYQAIQANKVMEQETLRRIVERTAE